jgi:hypothetical protein
VIFVAAKPISIEAFGGCVFTTTASSSCTLHELVFDLLVSLQVKILTTFSEDTCKSGRMPDEHTKNYGRKAEPRITRITESAFAVLTCSRKLSELSRFRSHLSTLPVDFW